jgi:hypothetical protein
MIFKIVVIHNNNYNALFHLLTTLPLTCKTLSIIHMILLSIQFMIMLSNKWKSQRLFLGLFKCRDKLNA